MRALIAALVLTLAGTTAATAAVPASGGTPTLLVIRVKSHVVQSFKDEKPPQGDSKGDRYLIRDSLVNVAKQFGKRAGAVVGHDSGAIVLTGPKTGRFVGVATLPGGTIRLAGIVSLTLAPGPPLKVTGGTGKYARATGSVVIGAGAFPLNTYRLTLPV